MGWQNPAECQTAANNIPITSSLCRKLAVTDAPKGRLPESMVQTALAIAKQWRWGEHKAKLLIDDPKAYNLCRTPFAGGHADGLAWWERLAVSVSFPFQLTITSFKSCEGLTIDNTILDLRCEIFAHGQLHTDLSRIR
ncbi:hypothetical protein BDR04DRAFT_791758 [Suillus decipiens]|nr:hypothetical protein BDR04DRAFT_791758 [Suillus decipiens]